MADPREQAVAPEALDRVQPLRVVGGRSFNGELDRLYDELREYPGVSADAPPSEESETGMMLLHHLRLEGSELSFFSTVTTFGTATDITIAELAIEAFYPADAETAGLLRDRDRPR